MKKYICIKLPLEVLQQIHFVCDIDTKCKMNIVFGVHTFRQRKVIDTVDKFLLLQLHRLYSTKALRPQLFLELCRRFDASLQNP